MRTRFVAEFGHASVNTDALLCEASRDARLLADSKTILVWSNVDTFRYGEIFTQKMEDITCLHHLEVNTERYNIFTEKASTRKEGRHGRREEASRSVCLLTDPKTIPISSNT